MTAFACTYLNSASTALNLNDGSTNILRAPGPAGLFAVFTTAVVATLPRKAPAGIYQVNNLKMRKIVVPVLVRGASPSALTTSIRTLWAALYVDARDDTMGTFKYTAANNNERWIKAVLGEDADINEWLAAGTSDPAGARIDIPLICPDPSFYASAPVTPAGAFDGTTPVNISCANPGDVDAYATITYTGIVNNPSVTDAYGHVMEITITTTHADDALVLTLDPQNLSIVYTPNGGAATDYFGYRTAASQMAYVKHGTNNLTFVGDDAGDDATIGVSFSPRYSTHG